MLCLNYLNKTVELLFILYNFAIVPSVGTGIKAAQTRWYICRNKSYPPWVRGLKHKMIELLTDTIISYPSWVRGLKQRNRS